MSLKIFFVVSTLARACPNSCSGHGDCVLSRCECWQGFELADCSWKMCPFGISWNPPREEREECSGKGLCDNGKCVCQPGFDGSACERLACRCGHCESLNAFAERTTNAKSERYSYDSWDSRKLFDCVDRAEECPRGDDPLTTNQQNEIQIFSCGGVGYFTLWFRGRESSRIYHHYSAEQVRSAIESTETGSLSVKFHGGRSACHRENANFEERNVISIEFTSLFGDSPPFRVDQEHFSGNVQAGDVLRSATGYVYGVQGSKEFEECARRGRCVDGVCECYATNFELYGSSDLYGGPGQTGDCGYPLTEITTCPGEEPCNNNGVCLENNKCVCKTGWKDGDCSKRICPRHYSWFSYPSADNKAHDGLTECSSVGECTQGGACDCPEPFFGAACEYVKCHRNCNGHGRCVPSRNFGEWDDDRIFKCECDAGYDSFDCSRRTCPLGDDPETTDQVNEIQSLQCPPFQLSFRGETTQSIEANATTFHIQTQLEALSTVGKVRVSFGGGNTHCDAVVHVHFLTDHGDLPNIEGARHISTEVSRDGTTESEPCSNRGICDTSTGLCDCFEGYGASDGNGLPGLIPDCGHRIS